jgi:hypothetical protein
MNVDQVNVIGHAKDQWLNNIDRPAPARWSQRKEFLRKVLEETDCDSQQCQREGDRLIIRYHGTRFVFEETGKDGHDQFNLITFYAQTSALFVDEIKLKVDNATV